MALNQDIQNLLGGLKGQIPPPVFGKLYEMFHRLESIQTGAAAPKAGQHAPDVEFTNTQGEARNLASLYADKPLVLLFYRGRWCPFCDLTLRAYDRLTDVFQAAGANLVAVSPQTTAEMQKTSDERGLRYTLLRDAHNLAAQAFGLAWQLTPEEQELYAAFNSHVDQANGDTDWELPAPAAFVIDTNGTVRWSHVDSNWTRRAEPEEVLAAVRALTAKSGS